MSKIIIFLFGTFMIFFFIYFYYKKDVTFESLLLEKKIHKIEINNLKYLKRTEILNSIHVKKNQNFWLFNYSQLANDLDKINEVEKFKFELNPNGILKIDIKEKNPYIIWNNNGVFSFLDKTGKKLNYNRKFSNILTVHGNNVEENFLGLKNIIENKKKILPYKLNEIYLQKDLSWKLVFENFKCIIFPLEELEFHNNLIDKLKLMNFTETFNKIDFRIKGRIYLSDNKC